MHVKKHSLIFVRYSEKLTKGEMLKEREKRRRGNFDIESAYSLNFPMCIFFIV